MTEQLDRLRKALGDRYELVRELGEGGMATVYLANDVKHGRQVAIKILKPDLAAVIGAERFLNEIKVTAALQHPHILPLFDSGRADSFLFYVMPYVAGESLRARIEREKQLPVEEAVSIAREVGEALGYAHARGVVHRDVKPENVLLHEGRALVADFGIALAVSIAGGERITQTGVSYGTPNYMSPEQATGDRELDGRSDLYSLGCITYEMLAGRTPHSGPTVQAVFAQLLAEDPPPLRKLRGSVPIHVEAAVHSTLQKLPADRCPDAATFLDALKGARFRSPPGPSGRIPSRRTRVLLAIGAVLAAGGFMALGSLAPDVGSTVATRWLDLVLPDSAPMAFQGAGWQELRSLDFSRDGARIVYAAHEPDGGARLWTRSLDSPEFSVLPGTEGAYAPSFSPDGRWVAFFADGQLRKVAVEEASVVTLGDVADPAGATWLSDDEILVSEGNALIRFSAATGAREATSASCSGGTPPCLLPQALPGGEWVLVSSYADVAVVSLRTGERRAILEGLFEPQAQYLPNGYLAYFHRPGQLFAVKFDPNSMAVSGEPEAVLDQVRQGGFGSQFAVSREGTLVYAVGGHFIESRLTWVARDGTETPLPYEPQSFGVFHLSPDGRQIATGIYRTNAQIWIYDLDRPQPRPLVTEGSAQHPTWSPDGKEVAYRGEDAGAPRASIRAVDASASGATRVLIETSGYPFSWCEGDRISFVSGSGTTKSDIWVGSTTSGEAEPVLRTESVDDAPAFSPDARWIAYMSGLTGRWEVYAEPYPASGERWQLSVGGGAFPRWSADGGELYYVRDGAMFAVDVSGGPARASAPERLFEGPYIETFGHAFDISHDGRGFLMLKATDPRSASASLRLVENWLAEVADRTSR